MLTVAVLSLLVTRIAALALMLTGLSRDAARFQARSAFTGSGFTTSESESVINHPVRRQIIMMLMLLGNVGIATVVATVMLSMLQTAGAEQWWWNVGVFVAGLGALLLMARSRWVEHHLNRAIAFGLKRWTKLDVTDYVALLQLQNGYAVTEMQVEPEDWLAGKTLIEAALPAEGVLILGIQRSGGDYIGAPRGGDEIRAGDTLILYAPTHRLEELDQRTQGYGGERAHSEAVARYQTSGTKGAPTHEPEPSEEHPQ